VDAGLALAITVAGTIGGAAAGAAIGLKGARRLARDERAAVRREETARAYRAYVSAAVKSVSELRQLPPIPEPDAITEAVGAVVSAFRSEADEKMATKARIHRRYGDRHLVLADQLVTAGVELALCEIPPSARAAIKATDDYVIRLSDDRDEKLIAEWKEIHAALWKAGEDVRAWAESGELPDNAFPQAPHKRGRTTSC
jgi:hypothetical protein